MYPASFPKSPPFLRILNPNPQTYKVNPSFEKFRSKTDARSYLLNDCLQEIKGWKNSSSVASVIIEVNDLARNNYPFQLVNQCPNQNQMVNMLSFSGTRKASLSTVSTLQTSHSLKATGFLLLPANSLRFLSTTLKQTEVFYFLSRYSTQKHKASLNSKIKIKPDN